MPPITPISASRRASGKSLSYAQTKWWMTLCGSCRVPLMPLQPLRFRCPMTRPARQSRSWSGRSLGSCVGVVSAVCRPGCQLAAPSVGDQAALKRRRSSGTSGHSSGSRAAAAFVAWTAAASAALGGATAGVAAGGSGTGEGVGGSGAGADGSTGGADAGNRGGGGASGRCIGGGAARAAFHNKSRNNGHYSDG